MSLAKLAQGAGLTFVESVLQRRLGAQNGRLAADVLRAVAERAGAPAATAEAVEAVAHETPGRVIDAMREVERMGPELVELYVLEAEQRAALFAAEAAEPFWVRAWRPLGMYGLGLLWAWNTILLHVANAIWSIALPPMPFEQLIQLSALYMGLYMGGHTVKDVAAKWMGRG